MLHARHKTVTDISKSDSGAVYLQQHCWKGCRRQAFG